MKTTERVNQETRQRGYGARDRQDIIKSIIKLHNDGLSQVEIAKKVNIARGTILRWNKENPFFEPRTPGDAGKLKNKKYEYDEDYFEKIDTPNKAYMVGYITGDGTLSDRGKSKRLVMALAAEDEQLLMDIGNEMNMQEAVTFRKATYSNEQNKFSLCINSTKMCNDLIILGVTPRKTGHETWLDFQDDELQWAYLRGFFDADGHIRVYRRNGYLKARLGFTGNYEMLLSILEFFKAKGFALNVNSITEKQGCSDVYLSSVVEIREIFNFLYNHGDLKLNRKYEKYLSLMI